MKQAAGTPMRRAVSLRSVRTATAVRDGPTYSIDSDFEIDDSDDDVSSLLEQPRVHAPDRRASATAASSAIGSARNGTGVAGAMNAAGRSAGGSEESNSGVRRNRQSQLESQSDEQRQQRMSRLTQRAEEEAALNRAILLSLQESDVLSSSGARSGAGAAAHGDGSDAAAQQGDAGTPSESDVALLQGMGFSRDDAVQALRESRMNVQLAANRLLGTDF